VFVEFAVGAKNPGSWTRYRSGDHLDDDFGVADSASFECLDDAGSVG
jgi:hypothetical protein